MTSEKLSWLLCKRSKAENGRERLDGEERPGGRRGGKRRVEEEGGRGGWKRRVEEEGGEERSRGGRGEEGRGRARVGEKGLGREGVNGGKSLKKMVEEWVEFLRKQRMVDERKGLSEKKD